MSRVDTAPRADRKASERRPAAPARPAGRRVGLMARRIVFGIGVALLLFYLLLPFYWMLKSAFQSNLDVVSIPPAWFPREITLDAFSRATTMIPFTRYIFNSLFVSLTATILSVALASMAGYVLARFRFPGGTLILVLLLFTNVIPPITRIFPVYFLIQDLGLLNTYTGLIAAYVSFSVPLAALLLQAYFKRSYPRELEEAAMVDGCGLFGTFRRIVLPISIPGLVAIGALVFLGVWNDFLWASVLLYEGSMKTIQVGLADFIGEGGNLQYINAYMAACLMTAIPAFILFRAVQGHMVEGMSAGATKQ